LSSVPKNLASLKILADFLNILQFLVSFQSFTEKCLHPYVTVLPQFS